MSAVTRRIEVTELAKVYRKRRVVDGVSLNFEQGEIVGLLGPNGAGKSTTFYMIVGLIRPDSGKVLLDDKEVTKMPMYQRARRGIGYLAQEASVFRKLTVRENIMLVLEMTGFPRKDRRERTEQLMEDLKVAHRAEARGAELSGGERRRVEIARALAANPSFLLLDEPFAGIDPKAIEDIQEMVQALKSRGLGVLITDHNAAATLNLTDRAYVIVGGKVIFEGTRDEVAQNDDVQRYYLGENFKL